MIPSELVITRFHSTNVFWMLHVSYSHWYGYSEHSGFMKFLDYLPSSIRCLFGRERIVSFRSRNLSIHATLMFKDSKGIATTVFPNSSILTAVQTAVYIINLLFSWTHVRPVFNGTKKMQSWPGILPIVCADCDMWCVARFGTICTI